MSTSLIFKEALKKAVSIKSKNKKVFRKIIT